MTGLVRPVRVDPLGLDGPTRGQARGPSWRRAGSGLVVPSTVTDDLVEQRILEAATAAGPHAVVTAWAALRLLGGGFFDGLRRDGTTRLPVPVAANGGRIRARPGVLLTCDSIPDLLDVRRGVAGEFVGAGHRDIDQHESDVDRAARFRRVGLETFEVVRRDLTRKSVIHGRMDESAERAALLPRSWQLGPPPRDLDAILDARDAARGRRDAQTG